jgi:LmbE family N-acetylglucosaminyl deacetylase
MRVLVFGSHPDDIEIGMGGTVAKHSQAGDTVLMAVATVPSKRERRMAEAEEGARILGARLTVLDIDPDQLAHDRRTIQTMDRVLTEFRPDLIYTHWDQDSHQDHNAVSRSVISAARENRCSLLMYEQTIPGGIVPGGFKAQSFVDVSDFIERKLESILAHKSQMEANGDWWLQGVKGRAMYRGYQIHTKYAEAFEVVKEIEMQFRHRS